VNIGSVSSTMGLPGSSVYAGTKGALNSITLSLSKELGPRQIRVNAINPGLIETKGTRSSGIIGSEKSEIALSNSRRSAVLVSPEISDASPLS
jgi:3-oxoacyl-[acyl-carrier protein] reductase